VARVRTPTRPGARPSLLRFIVGATMGLHASRIRASYCGTLPAVLLGRLHLRVELPRCVHHRRQATDLDRCLRRRDQPLLGCSTARSSATGTIRNRTRLPPESTKLRIEPWLSARLRTQPPAAAALTTSPTWTRRVVALEDSSPETKRLQTWRRGLVGTTRTRTETWLPEGPHSAHEPLKPLGNRRSSPPEMSALPAKSVAYSARRATAYSRRRGVFRSRFRCRMIGVGSRVVVVVVRR
jgi:hypothetical protein